jgi:hypothetical protein
MSKIFTFFQDQTVNEVSDTYEVQDGGYRIIKATGVFDGAEIQVQFDFADDKFAIARSYQFSESDAKVIQPLKSGVRVRAALVNSGANTSVTVKIL